MSDSNNKLPLGIVSDLNRHLYMAIEKAIEKNNKEITFDLMKFVYSLIADSISNNSLSLFNVLIFFPPDYYFIGLKNNALKDIITDEAASQLKSIALYHLRYSFSSIKDIGEKKRLNEFSYWTICSFNSLFYRMITKQDIKGFKFAINEFNQLSENSSSKIYNLEFQLSELKRTNLNSNNDTQIGDLEEEIKVENYFTVLQRHLKFGLLSWLWLLYSWTKIDYDMLLEFTNLINLSYYRPDDEISDILFFSSSPLFMSGYLGWTGWDHTERMDGQSYSPPDPPHWLAFGFVIYNLRSLSIRGLTIEKIKDKDGLRFIRDEIKNHCDYIKKNFKKFSQIIVCPDEMELDNRISELLSIFNNIIKTYNLEVAKDIVEQELSTELILGFKEITGKAWDDFGLIHKLFEEYNAYTTENPKKIELLRFGQRTFFQRAKMFFIDKHYQPIYGMDRAGGEIGRWEDNYFFNEITNAKEHIKFNTVSDSIKALIKSLKDNQIEPTLIIMPPEFINDNLLNEDPDYKPYWKMEGDVKRKRFEAGLYSNIQIITSYNDYLKSKILVCNFGEAFELLQKKNSNWYKEQLEVEVTLVTIEQAKNEYSKNPNRWNKNEDGLDLTEEESLIVIQTSVNIDICIREKLIIKNKKAFAIGYL